MKTKTQIPMWGLFVACMTISGLTQAQPSGYPIYPNQSFSWSVVGTGSETWMAQGSIQTNIYANGYETTGTPEPEVSFNAPESGTATLSFTLTSGFDGLADVWVLTNATISVKNTIVNVFQDISGTTNGTKAFGVIANRTYYLAGEAQSPGGSQLGYGIVSATITYPALVSNTATRTASDNHNATVNASQGEVDLGGFYAEPQPLDGGVISGVSYTLSANNQNVVVVFSDTGTTTTANANAHIYAKTISPPSIITPPQSASIASGGSTNFNVVASGPGTLYYQWYFNTLPISGAVGTNIAIVNATTTNSGIYTVVVTNLVGSVLSAPATLAVSVPPPAALGATELIEGPTATNDTIILATPSTNYPWTASTDTAWLHVNATNQSGLSSGIVAFSIDANPGSSRTGTLTIAGVPLTIIQAGTTYIAAPGPGMTLVSSGLMNPNGVAVDFSGNVYIADTRNNVIREWAKTDNNVSTIVSSNSLNSPEAVAADTAGNLYIADEGDAAIKEWIAASNSLITLPISGLSSPLGVAVDTAGNVYFVDTGAVKEWIASSGVVTNLVSGLLNPRSVAVDFAGNVYFVSYYTSGIRELGKVTEWSASSGSQTVLASGLGLVGSASVDGSGNLYLAFQSEIFEVPALSTNRIPVASGFNFAADVAVDSHRNIYIVDSGGNILKEMPHAFVDPTPRLVGLAAGNDSLPPVVPVTANLLPPFTPTTDQSWLNIASVSNGVVGFAFNANSGPARRSHIIVLGQTNAITQGVVGAPAMLTRVQIATGGPLQFVFTNVSSGAFTVLCTTNPSLPLNDWSVLGVPVENPPGQYKFIDPRPVGTRSFYNVRSP